MAIWDIKERYKKVRATEIRNDRALLYNNASSAIEKINISTTGNSSSFGTLTQDRGSSSCFTSTTRGICVNGSAPSTSNVLDYVTIASEGNAADFGDSTNSTRDSSEGALGNNVRGIRGGGATPSHTNVIDYNFMASLGDSIDFGDLAAATRAGGAVSSTTRGLFAGGSAPGDHNVIQYVTISTTGNTTDFGDLTTTINSPAANSSSTRAVFMGNHSPSVVSTIDTVQIATTGNAADFGDITVARGDSGSASNSIRGLCLGGTTGGGTLVNVIDYITIATFGNATDFGDLANADTLNSMAMPAHGGIDLDSIQRPSVTYMPGSGKTLICGGQLSPGAGTVDIDTYNIPTLGNARNFGDLSKTASNGIGCASSYTRAVFSSGYYFTSPYYSTEMQAIEFATEGNVCDFGDTTQERYGMAYGNVGNTTRGLFMGGYAPSSPYIVNIIDYITIATMGNATDFGDLTNVKQSPAAASNNTRGINFGGTTPTNINIIDYVTIASTGDSTDFGDITVARHGNDGASGAS